MTRPLHSPDDQLHEECGVVAVGVGGKSGSGIDAALVAALALHALQHRGQEGCGIVTYDGQEFHHERHLGLVGDHFGGAENATLPQRLPGHAAVGHTRYATAGGGGLNNVQPLFANLALGGFALAHNGNLTNATRLRRQLVNTGAIFQSTSDTEVVLQLIARSTAVDIPGRFIDALKQIEGGYAFVCLTEVGVMAARDPHGIRPLVLGWLDDDAAASVPVLVSETCALTAMGARFDREVAPGEVLIISSNSSGVATLESRFPLPRVAPRPCLFEFVYFARPDSVIDGRSVYAVRKQMGARLAAETAVDADIVIPVPDSGIPAALGYAVASGLPYDMGIVRNHYIGRTFIQPTQSARNRDVSLKHTASPAVVAGKRVVVVDDSIVRGTTSKRIIAMLRAAGASEVHFRSASPQIKYGDFYGIDMPDAATLFAAQHKGDMAAMTAWLGADSLGFLSIEGAYAAVGLTRDPTNPQFSDHCFTGDYPTRLTDTLDAAEKEAQKDVA